MQIVSGVQALNQGLANPFARCVVTIGNFDGVHEGHRSLIRRLVQLAQEQKVPSVVFTFHPHPVQVLHPDRALRKLFSLEDQHQQLEALGVDYLIVEPFSREFSQVDPEQYLNRWVFKPLSPVVLIVGYDFTFGVGRTGTIDFLQAACAKMGITVEVLPPFKSAGILVSSTRIRQALSEGDVELAARLLGRPFYVQGIVEKGLGRGRQLGVPTANLHLFSETLPIQGVYACRVQLRGEIHGAVTNIGVSPTFQSQGDQREAPLRLETHLYDFSGDMYGYELKVEFLKFLRSESKFNSREELKSQIHKDIGSAREVFRSLA